MQPTVLPITPENDSITPLMRAVIDDNQAEARKLYSTMTMDAINAKNNDGETATDIALNYGHPQLAEKLLQMRLIDLAYPAE